MNVTITCKNCGQQVLQTENKRCENCNKSNWGYKEPPTPPTNVENPIPTPPTNVENPIPITPTNVENPIPITPYHTECGWLVIHTEGMANQSYKLQKGNNIFGRPTDESKVNIQITGDKQVSRHHAQIEVINNEHGFKYWLTDNLPQLRGGHGSLNGTYLNGISQRLPVNEKRELSDGDTIQIGKIIKLVLKTPKTVRNESEATAVVQQSDYTATVIL